VFSMDLVVYFH